MSDIVSIYECYTSKVLPVSHKRYTYTKPVCEANTDDTGKNLYSHIKKVNIFIRTDSGTIENRYSAEIEPGNINTVDNTTTLVGTDTELGKSIQVVLTKDSPTSIVVTDPDNDHPDLVRFEDNLTYFERNNTEELNIFINE